MQQVVVVWVQQQLKSTLEMVVVVVRLLETQLVAQE